MKSVMLRSLLNKFFFSICMSFAISPPFLLLDACHFSLSNQLLGGHFLLPVSIFLLRSTSLPSVCRRLMHSFVYLDLLHIFLFHRNSKYIRHTALSRLTDTPYQSNRLEKYMKDSFFNIYTYSNILVFNIRLSL